MAYTLEDLKNALSKITHWQTVFSPSGEDNNIFTLENIRSKVFALADVYKKHSEPYTSPQDTYVDTSPCNCESYEPLQVGISAEKDDDLTLEGLHHLIDNFQTRESIVNLRSFYSTNCPSVSDTIVLSGGEEIPCPCYGNTMENTAIDLNVCYCHGNTCTSDLAARAIPSSVTSLEGGLNSILSTCPAVRTGCGCYIYNDYVNHTIDYLGCNCNVVNSTALPDYNGLETDIINPCSCNANIKYNDTSIIPCSSVESACSCNTYTGVANSDCSANESCACQNRVYLDKPTLAQDPDLSNIITCTCYVQNNGCAGNALVADPDNIPSHHYICNCNVDSPDCLANVFTNPTTNTTTTGCTSQRYRKCTAEIFFCDTFVCTAVLNQPADRMNCICDGYQRIESDCTSEAPTTCDCHSQGDSSTCSLVNCSCNVETDSCTTNCACHTDSLTSEPACSCNGVNQCTGNTCPSKQYTCTCNVERCSSYSAAYCGCQADSSRCVCQSGHTAWWCPQHSGTTYCNSYTYCSGNTCPSYKYCTVQNVACVCESNQDMTCSCQNVSTCTCNGRLSCPSDSSYSYCICNKECGVQRMGTGSCSCHSHSPCCANSTNCPCDSQTCSCNYYTKGTYCGCEHWSTPCGCNTEHTCTSYATGTCSCNTQGNFPACECNTQICSCYTYTACTCESDTTSGCQCQGHGTSCSCDVQAPCSQHSTTPCPSNCPSYAYCQTHGCVGHGNTSCTGHYEGNYCSSYGTCTCDTVQAFHCTCNTEYCSTHNGLLPTDPNVSPLSEIIGCTTVTYTELTCSGYADYCYCNTVTKGYPNCACFSQDAGFNYCTCVEDFILRPPWDGGESSVCTGYVGNIFCTCKQDVA